MAEATPTDVYNAFCAECATLEATIATLEAAPALATLDELSAAKTRLALVQAAIPDLCAASERYEREQRYAAALALQAPRWTNAAAAKVTALGEVATRLTALLESVDAYATAHGTQMGVLIAMDYSREYRARFSSAPASLAQIVITVTQGDRSWLARVPTFDDIGVLPTLPNE